MIKIAVFASGEGTNLQALIDSASAGRIRGQIVLVVSSSPEAGALKRARRAGIPVEISHPRDFPTPEEYNAHLARLCKNRGIGLICLAGFMLQVREPLLKAFPWRIMNIHPALLPSFGGKGMYGRAVHEAVLRSGARVTGCTVHLIDAEYDKGLVVWQSAAPVLAGDTPETLAARVRTQEHWAYPKAVGLFCEGRIQAAEGGLKILPSPLDQSPRIKRALLTTADKTGLVDFARGLSDLGVELVSTSGTGRSLKEAGLSIRSIDTLTGFPEILSGRVKTLHPSVHGAILFRRKDPSQSKEAELLGIEPIDMVVVNLYPFAKTAAQAPSPFSPEVIEQIDIGGPALIRAAAKNFEHVAVLVSPQDYAPILKELDGSAGTLGPETLRRLATTAFRHTAEYDRMISEAWSRVPAPVGGGVEPAPAPPSAPREPEELFPKTLTVGLRKIQDLRYGENPHQRASLYSEDGTLSFKQIHGKELSYNNLLDVNGVWEAVAEFQEPAAAIFKHVTPSGVGTGETVFQAIQRAWACDPLSAFGGVIAVNRKLDDEIAEELAQRFIEVIIAPEFDPEALALLKKKSNLRLLIRRDPPANNLVFRSLGSEVLAMEPDRLVFGEKLECATKRKPSKAEEEALRFAWIVCKHVKSNAIVLAHAGGTVGIGAGQMSRVDAVRMSGLKYEAYRRDNPAPDLLVMASDAFFPFKDGIETASSFGVSAVIQPGGSVKDGEVIACADEKGVAMLFTGLRHFRH